MFPYRKPLLTVFHIPGFNLWHTTASPNKKLPNELYFHVLCWGIPLLLSVVAVQWNFFLQFGPPNGFVQIYILC